MSEERPTDDEQEEPRESPDAMPPSSSDDAGTGTARWRAFVANLVDRARHIHPAAWLTGIAAVSFAIVFGELGVQNHRNFGTWAYDMGIYDQGFWLVSEGGGTFMTVRGLDFWGHHVNLIAYAFAPFYWMGAGPSFLYLAQAGVIALGAAPTYLIARDRFARHWVGLLFAVVYLMYAPVQWLTWAMFHPEALVITPFLFAWWFATRRQWRWFFAMILLIVSAREDAALAVVMLGLVLLVSTWRDPDRRRSRWMAVATSALGLGWYLVATRLVIPHFNGGEQPFYVEFFFRDYGSSVPEVVGTILTEPDQVVSDATRPDRLRFYRDLMLPWGGLPLAGPLPLLMAGPQMLASVIGTSPYARMIRYQYTSVMIAPIVIASIQGAWLLWRFRVMRWVLPVWMLVCAYTTNVAWSPSPIGDHYPVWAKSSPRHDAMREAVALVPGDAAVSATYNILPHMSQRREIYDWPNPFVPNVWGNSGCDNLPDPVTIEYIALDRHVVGEAQGELLDEMLDEGGPFEIVFDADDVVVAKRVGIAVSVDVRPQADSCPDADQE